MPIKKNNESIFGSFRSFQVALSSEASLESSNTNNQPPHHLEFPGRKMKLLRACNFCRKRKVKCITSSQNGKCDTCNSKNIPCSFGHKFLKAKRKWERQVELNEKLEHEQRKLQYNSKHVGDSVLAADISNSNATMAVSKRKSSSLSKSTNPHLNDNPLWRLYVALVEPFTPFISPEVFVIKNKDERRFVDCCMQIASSTATANSGADLDESVSYCHKFLERETDSWNLLTLSCFFLLPLRVKISKKVVKNSLAYFNTIYEKEGGNVPIELSIGALVNDAFFSLFENSTSLMTNRKILQAVYLYLSNASSKEFHDYFIYVACYTYKLLDLVHTPSIEEKKIKKELLCLENEILLFPVNLTRELAIIDKSFASEKGLLLHIIHNDLLIFYYAQALFKYGGSISVYPTPGICLFLANAAGSSFLVNNQIVHRWALAGNSMVFLADLLLKLYTMMEFESIKMSLTRFKMSPNVSDSQRQKDVNEKVCKLLSLSEVVDEGEAYGAIVFWVFRDTRSMSIQEMLHRSSDA